MKRTPVRSSSIASIGYDPREEILEIQFHNTGLYQYFEVPEDLYDLFASAPSKGAFFDRYIRNAGFPYTKLN